MDYLTLDDVELNGRRVLLREDLNVPMQDGKITSSERIDRALPTIRRLLKANAGVLILSHLGRPKEGEYDEQYSLAPIAEALSQALEMKVPLVKNWLDGCALKPGQVALAENVRFNKGENANDLHLAKKMAAVGDIFVMDAFATAHRAQASTVGIGEFADVVCAGPLLDSELKNLNQAFKDAQKPLVAIVGGSKVSTKFQLLESLLKKVDVLIVGGGIANTFIKAKGFNIGKSLYEAEWVEKAKELLSIAEKQGIKIPLPIDVRVAKTFSKEAKAEIKAIDEVADDDMILDVGPKTEKTYAELMATVKTIVWNGPVGVFEFPQFANGTEALARAIAKSSAFSVAGGGDTLSALAQFNLSDQISYVSTGGGAFLEYLQGDTLPAVALLQSRKKTV